MERAKEKEIGEEEKEEEDKRGQRHALFDVSGIWGEGGGCDEKSPRTFFFLKRGGGKS